MNPPFLSRSASLGSKASLSGLCPKESSRWAAGRRLPGPHKVGHAGGAEYGHAAIGKALQPLMERETQRFRQESMVEDGERPEPECLAAGLDESGARQSFVDEAAGVQCLIR